LAAHIFSHLMDDEFGATLTLFFLNA